jgi:Skp family chaperone for outer membrane proteins
MADSSTAAAATISVEDYNKAVERARTFEAKATDYEKKYNGIDPEAHKAMKEELEIIRRESAAGDPKKIESLVTKARQEAGGA